MTQPPPGAGPDVQLPYNSNNPDVLNTKLTPEPVNAFQWGAAVMRGYKRLVPEKFHPQLEQNAAWLDYLGSRVNYMHRDPVIMLGICRMALDMKLRHMVVQVLGMVETVTTEASSGQGQSTG